MLLYDYKPQSPNKISFKILGLELRYSCSIGGRSNEEDKNRMIVMCLGSFKKELI